MPFSGPFSIGMKSSIGRRLLRPLPAFQLLACLKSLPSSVKSVPIRRSRSGSESRSAMGRASWACGWVVHDLRREGEERRVTLWPDTGTTTWTLLLESRFSWSSTDWSSTDWSLLSFVIAGDSISDITRFLLRPPLCPDDSRLIDRCVDSFKTRWK